MKQMTTTTKRNQSDSLVLVTLRWPQSLINEIDELRGAYMSRNKAILMLMEEHLNERKNKKD